MKHLNRLLCTAAELKKLLTQDQVTLIDVRDRDDYLSSHIAGAINLPQLFYYLAESTPEGLEMTHFELGLLMRKAGISKEKPVVVYEDSLDTRYGGSCRGFWLLTYAGHPHVAILDGGLDAWKAAGYSLTTGETVVVPSTFEVCPQTELIATLDDVAASLDDGSIVVIDNRDIDERQGASSSPYGIDFAPRKGRIPGSKWLEWYEFLDRTQLPVCFKSPEAIRAWCYAQGIRSTDNIILYCFKGARSANTYIALTLAGFYHVRLFLGSWNEWSRDERLPIL